MESEYLVWVKTRTPGQYNLASSGIVPYPIKDLAVRSEEIEINGRSLYGYPPLQAEIAAHCGVPNDLIVASSGTSMANFLALAALIEPGDDVLVEEPAYEPLLAAVKFFRGSIRRLKREPDAGFQLPPPEDFVSSKTKLIILTNLHNPSSAVAPEETLRHYGEVAKRLHARVLMDEVYLECIYEEIPTACNYGPEFVVTGSLTKAYGLGGLRCGWVVAEPALAQRIWKIKDLIDPSAPHPAELLSVIAFRKLNQISERAKTLLSRNRALVHEFFASCDRFDCAIPQFGTCIFPRFKHGYTDRLVEILHERYDTDVVPGRFFDMPDRFRLGIGVETEVLVEGLRRLRTATEEI